MEPITGLGLAAAASTTVAFLPQVIKNWRTRSSDDLSFATFGLLTFGVGLWLAYGIAIGDLPIMVANSITLALQVANLAQMISHRRARRPGGRLP